MKSSVGILVKSLLADQSDIFTNLYFDGRYGHFHQLILYGRYGHLHQLLFLWSLRTITPITL